jgi:DNA-binding transcriptional regulator YhcF (GntR family)
MTSSPPLYETIASQLREMIRDRRFVPGEKLPGHTELARMFAVSSITSNRALRELEQDGLVERRVRQGTFVRDISRKLRTVAVPLDAAESRYTPQLMEYLDGVLQEAEARDIRVRLLSLEEGTKIGRKELSALQCQGVLRLGGHTPGFPRKAIRDCGLPWVVAGEEEPEANGYANEDRRGGAAALTRLLREDGFRRIGIIGTFAWRNHNLCREGYREVVGADMAEQLSRDLTPHVMKLTPHLVVEVLEELAPQVDALLVTGGSMFNLVAWAWLQGNGNSLPLGFFNESREVATLQQQVYFCHLPHADVGGRALRLLADLVENPQFEQRAQLLDCTATRPASGRR